MAFSSEPTALGDDIASYLRDWYEKNRETFWERHGPGADRAGFAADGFMLALINELRRIDDAADRYLKIKR